MNLGDLVQGINRFFGGLDSQQTVQGWGRVRWDMSRQAVARNYPQATERGGYLVLSGETPPGRSYEIAFGFNDTHQLDQVSLSFGGSSEVADFAALSEEITRRLGGPIAQTDSTTTWRKDRGEITLSKSPDGGVVMSQSV